MFVPNQIYDKGKDAAEDRDVEIYLPCYIVL